MIELPPVKSIEEQIKKMLESTLSDEELVPILKSEAERLKGLIQKHIDEYLASYSPKGSWNYSRKWGTLKDCLLVNPKVYNRSIDVYFDEDKAWGESVIDLNKWGWGFKPILIDQGWQVGDDVPFRHVYRFGWYEGYHFLQRAIDEFQNTNPYGLHIEVIVTPHANSEFSGHFKLRSDHRDIYNNMGF